MGTEERSMVAEIAAGLTGDGDMPARMAAHAKSVRMVSLLADCRARKGMTQGDVASRMGVSVSKVSRFEDSADADARIGDLAAYAGAVGVNVSLALDDSETPTSARIKDCVLRIADDLHNLSLLAAGSRGDGGIIDGIRRFREEVLFNFLLHYVESGGSMPARIEVTGTASEREAALPPGLRNPAGVED